MRIVRTCCAAFGLVILGGTGAKAQVAFQPVVGSFPNGVMLSATPVVSHDRRYVRLGINPQFNALIGFDPFIVPGAVTGGGAGGAGGAGRAGAGLLNVGVMNGPIAARPAGGPRIAVDSGTASASAQVADPSRPPKAIDAHPASGRQRP